MSQNVQVFLRDCPSYDQELLRNRIRDILTDAKLPVAGCRVLLKPSFVYPARSPSCLAISTQPELVAATVHVLDELGAREVMIAEDSLLGPSEVAFTAVGLRRYLGSLGTLVPLQNETRVTVEVPEPFVEERFSVPKIWRDADLFISLPKIKVNMYTDVTLSVKNNFGFLLKEHRLPNHNFNLHRKIADLYKVRPPNFVIVDSIVAGEGQGPMSADPVWLKVLLAGANALAVDAVACLLMGFHPMEVEHLRLLHGAGMGPIDLDDLQLEDPSLLEERKRKFRRPRTDFNDLPDDIQVVTGNEVCCPSGCSGMIRNSLDQWIASGKTDRLRGYTFIVGKEVEQVPKCNPRKTIVVGDCAAKHADKGTYIPGCSVPPLSIVSALAKKGTVVPMRTRHRDLVKGFVARAFRRSL